MTYTKTITLRGLTRTIYWIQWRRRYCSQNSPKEGYSPECHKVALRLRNCTRHSDAVHPRQFCARPLLYLHHEVACSSSIENNMPLLKVVPWQFQVDVDCFCRPNSRIPLAWYTLGRLCGSIFSAWQRE